ncbi:hypothetical protein G8C92_31095 [Paenibacillus donghaensis]|uniref:hypothetical protein n=1 Tax=Paenibacillus donghaensis TaxID=414771 RepID=UPI0018847497|nr:hypothetical protein [Paenibacillus donghaensis]MBE9918436.1 hypothetical protein [Paenibacillus donghaensis]
MPITFCSAKNLKEAFSATLYHDFQNEVRNQLINIYNSQKDNEFKFLDLLVRLDPYGVKEFTYQELSDLIILLKQLITTVHDIKTKDFLTSLKVFCEEIQKTGNKLVALGD